jgi:hypothetical protein
LRALPLTRFLFLVCRAPKAKSATLRSAFRQATVIR